MYYIHIMQHYIRSSCFLEILVCKIVIWCNVRIGFRWLYSASFPISLNLGMLERDWVILSVRMDRWGWCISIVSISTVQMQAGYDSLQIRPSNFPSFVSRWCCFSSCQRFARWNCFAISMLACKQKTWKTLRISQPSRMFSESRRVMQPGRCTGSSLPSLDLRNRFVCWLMRAAIQSRHCRWWSTPWASSPSSHQAPSTWWNLATTYQACY